MSKLDRSGRMLKDAIILDLPPKLILQIVLSFSALGFTLSKKGKEDLIKAGILETNSDKSLTKALVRVIKDYPLE